MIFNNVSFSGGFEVVPPVPAPVGQQAYTTPGTYSWVCPESVFSVSVVCVGGGGVGAFERDYTSGNEASGGGAGLGWKNNILVTPGQTYTVVVGAGAPTFTLPNPSNKAYQSTPAGDSYFISPTLVKGGGGGNASAGGPGQGGTYVGDGGGNGGNGAYAGGGTNYSGAAGGGGAGGYTGNGGNARADFGSQNPTGNGYPGNGGGGGAGAGYDIAYNSGSKRGGSGGGVGIYGQGSNGTGGASSTIQSSVFGGGGGSGGTNGSNGGSSTGGGGLYGGGGAGYNSGTSGSSTMPTAGDGAVRLIWSGTTGMVREFPSTNTGDL